MSSNTLETVRVEITDGIAEVTISRPKALNAINRQVLRDLGQVFDQLRSERSLTCVILTGEGDRAFVAGADISEMSGMSTTEAQEFSRAGHQLFAAIESFPAPVLAAVNGFALGGGCELALSCDIVYAAEKARFGQPEVKLGIIPGFGGCVRLPRKVAPGVAAEWIYAGEMYSAQAAKEVGLVREVLPAAELLPRVREIAKLIGKRGPLAVRAAKRAMVQGLATHPAAAAAIEQLSFAQLFTSQDAREGTRAFVEKREPNFTGA